MRPSTVLSEPPTVTGRSGNTATAPTHRACRRHARGPAEPLFCKTGTEASRSDTFSGRRRAERVFQQGRCGKEVSRWSPHTNRGLLHTSVEVG